MLNLNLPSFEYSLKKKDHKLYIYDVVRKKEVLLTPEEWVRQHVIHYLIRQKQIPLSYITLESGLKYNQRQKRSDILVLSKELESYILIECKAATVALSKDVLLQLSTYNTKLNARYLGITNGLNHYYWEADSAGYHAINDLPIWPNQ